MLRVDSSSKPSVYITHNATLSHWGDITGRNLSDYMQLPHKPPKALYYFYTVVLLMTLMYKNGGVTL